MADARTFHHMLLHVKTLTMDEQDAKADYIRHNKEVLAHVSPDKVLPCGKGYKTLAVFGANVYRRHQDRL